jgi:hypothetical protein
VTAAGSHQLLPVRSLPAAIPGLAYRDKPTGAAIRTYARGRHSVGMNE